MLLAVALSRATMRSVDVSVWRALQGTATMHKAIGLETWRACLVDGRVPSSRVWPETIDPRDLVPLARLTQRHPRLVPGALRVLVGRQVPGLVEAAESLSLLEEALGDASVVDSIGDLSVDGGGSWRARGPGLQKLKELAARLETDLKELTKIFEDLGRSSGDDGKDARADSTNLQEEVDGYSLRTRDAAKATTLEKALRARKPSLFKARLASRTLAGLDVVSVDDGASREAPVGPRGPIVCCLDTSHSMAGSRETLSKAVVVAATRAALRQGRDVFVLAFSGTHDLAQVSCRVTDLQALDKLLKFLTCGFGGGTDVAAPLRRALKQPEWRDADIVIVSDGELMDPPLDATTLSQLQEARRDRGLKVAGFLAGRARPPLDPYKNARPGSPFARLCDGPVNTLLADRDDLSLMLRTRTIARAAARDGYEDAVAAALSAAEDRAPPVLPGDATTLENAVAYVERGLVDRAAEARLAVLGALAHEHVLFVGPPGTAKSLLCRRLGRLLSGDFFEIALTRFTTPDDVFGPLSLAALDNDEYRRAATGNFAQHAKTIFLDEIFRAKTVLPALLPLLNERLWWDGPEPKPAELVCAVAAANSRPDDDDDALFDRFLLRKTVLPVADDRVKDLVLSEDDDEDDVAPAWPPSSVPLTELPAFAVDFLCDARRHLRDGHSLQTSDRRLRKCARLLRVVAGVCGRASCLDLLVARYVLGADDDALVADYLFNAVVPVVDPAFRPLLASARADLSSTDLYEIEGLVDAIAEAVVEMRRHTHDLDAAEHPLIPPRDLERARQQLAPQAAARLGDLERLLQCAVDLRRAKITGDLTAVESFDDDVVFEDDDDIPVVLDRKVVDDDDESPRFDLSWSKKQAKARLTPAEFRQWTEQRRRMRV